MNITSSKPKATPKSTITLSVPKVDADAVSDGIWNAADKVAIGARKVGIGLFGGAICTIPVVGLQGARAMRYEMDSGKMRKTGLNQIANAGTAVAQIAGLSTGLLTAGSLITGIGNAWTLAKVSAGCFVAGGVATFATVMASDPKDMLN